MLPSIDLWIYISIYNKIARIKSLANGKPDNCKSVVSRYAGIKFMGTSNEIALR